MLATQVVAPVVVKKILFATDFSPVSEAALQHAAALGRVYQAEVVLLHVMPPTVRAPIPMDSLGLQIDPDRKDAERKLLKLDNHPELEGVKHEVMLRRGELWPVCADIINSHRIDLVVVGTHGRGGLMKLLLGSGAEEILRRALVPVLCVGPDAGGHAPEAIHNVLYATSFSPGSDAALAFALSLAVDPQRRLTLLHAVEDLGGALAADPGPLLRAAEERLRALLPESVVAEVRVISRFGTAAETILQVAAEEKSDLVVMGARHTGAVGSATHLPWSVAHAVVAHAPCPVLTVREAVL